MSDFTYDQYSDQGFLAPHECGCDYDHCHRHHGHGRCGRKSWIEREYEQGNIVF